MMRLDNAKLEPEVDESSVALESPAVRFPASFIVVAKRKWFVVIFVGAAAVTSAVISLLLPKMWTATTRIMPPQQNQSLSLTAMLSQLGPLAGLAQGMGVRTPSDVYVAMLRSDTVANALIERFDLMKYYQAKLHLEARKKLESRTSISAGKEGIISVTVDDRDPKTAAEIANGYAKELETLSKDLAISEAAQRRKFFERETRQAMDDLAAAETALKQTQEKTGIILLEPQSRAMMEALQALRAHVAAKEVEIQMMRSYAAPGNPDLVRAEQELAALRQQVAKLEVGGGKPSIADVPIENVPAAGLEYLRRYREVKYRETLFELLAKQFEAAKIDEARDTFLVQQLDVAAPPEKRSWPLRTMIVAASTVLALLLAILIVFFIDRLEEARKDPQFANQLQLFMFYLGRRS